VKVKPELIFAGDKPATDEDELIAPAVEISYSTIKVRVRGSYRVVHAGKPYTAGDGVFELPADETTSQWVRAGWVERAEKGK
jgi:hypothetical protein